MPWAPGEPKSAEARTPSRARYAGSSRTMPSPAHSIHEFCRRVLRSGNIEDKLAAPLREGGLPSVFERHIPNPDPEQPSLRQLIRLQVKDRELIDHLWFGRGHIEIRHPLVSRLDLLKLRATGRAWYGKFRWSLPAGEIME